MASSMIDRTPVEEKRTPRDPKPGRGGHMWFRCPTPCYGCIFCEGGLATCVVCGAFEGQILSTCPGYHLSEETLDACYQGNVADMDLYRTHFNAGLVREDGKWIRSDHATRKHKRTKWFGLKFGGGKVIQFKK